MKSSLAVKIEQIQDTVMQHLAPITETDRVASKTEPVAELAYRALEHRIVTLQLAPGTVTTEGMLIEQLALGRTPVREAIQRLAWEGLMEVRPRAGIAIAALNAHDWIKVLDARHGLEITLAKSAARFTTPNMNARFHQAAINIQHAVVSHDVSAYLSAGKALDTAIILASENPYAGRVVAPLQTHSRRFWYRYQAERSIAYAAEQHVRIISAILDGDEKAAAKETTTLINLLKKKAEAAARL